MGLSLQLFVHLSKLLAQHGVEADTDCARELVELARARVPDLLEQSDPGNTHTAVISAVALARGLELATDEGRQLALANALEWVLHKQIPATAMAGLGASERSAVLWARDALKQHREQLDAQGNQESEPLWQPAASARGPVVRALPSLDPMLVPDVASKQLEDYAREHGIVSSAGNQAPSLPVLPTEPTQPSVPATSKRAVFALDESSAMPAPGRIATRVEPQEDLIEVTGYSTTSTPEVMRARSTVDWGVRGWLALSLLIPPVALFCCGLFMGRKQAGLAMAMFAAGLVGWAGWMFVAG